MNQSDVRKRRFLFVCIAAAVIAAGLIVLFTAGFGKSYEEDGGWMLSARVSSEFDFSASSMDEIRAYVGGLFSVPVEVTEETFADVYHYVVVRSFDDLNMDAAAFFETVNGRFPGLLMADWTDLLHLSPSAGIGEILPSLIAAAVLLLLIFLACWLLMGAGSAGVVAGGAAFSALLTVTGLALLRLPATYGSVLTAVCFGSLLSVVFSVLVLRRLQSAVSGGKRQSQVAAVNAVIKGTGKPVCLYLSAAAGSAALLAGLGLVFSAVSLWYFFTAALFLSAVAPLFYSMLLLPGFFRIGR